MSEKERRFFYAENADEFVQIVVNHVLRRPDQKFSDLLVPQMKKEGRCYCAIDIDVYEEARGPWSAGTSGEEIRKAALDPSLSPIIKQ